MSPPPAVTLTIPSSPSRARSVSQPIREDVASDFSSFNVPSLLRPSRSGILRSHSSNSIQRSSAINGSSGGNANTVSNQNRNAKGRARSSSLVMVTEVGGDEPENVVDRLGVGTNENAAWVNGPGECHLRYSSSRRIHTLSLAGAWLIHPTLILLAKVLVDAIPGMTQDYSWTIVNLGYMAVSGLYTRKISHLPSSQLSFLMFHYVTGVPFEST